MPIVTITDVVRDCNDMQTRERAVALFGYVVYRLCECYPITRERAVGFNSDGNGLTYIEDE